MTPRDWRSVSSALAWSCVVVGALTGLLTADEIRRSREAGVSVAWLTAALNACVLLILAGCAGAIVLARGVAPARASGLSRRERAALAALVSGPRRGQEIVDASTGVLSRGTVYVLLAGLGERGLITGAMETAEGGAIPRRVFSITAEGLRTLRGAA